MSKPSVVVIVLTVLGAAALAAFLTHGRSWRLPDRYNPWAPLVIDEVPGWLTRYKLLRLADDPAQCRAVLATSGFRSEPLSDRDTGADCGFRNAVRVRSLQQIGVAQPFALSCPAAVSLALWERHVLLPESRRLLGAPVQGLSHFGSYACRNVNHLDNAPRSRHATADALDVAGFVLPGGRRLTVARDWPGETAASQFLQAAHDGACRFFDGVLGPDYNAAHHDHLHLERGGWRTCR